MENDKETVFPRQSKAAAHELMTLVTAHIIAGRGQARLWSGTEDTKSTPNKRAIDN